MKKRFHSSHNSMRAHISNAISYVRSRNVIKYAVINQLLFCFFYLVSVTSTQRLPWATLHHYFKVKFTKLWKDIFLRIALDCLILAGVNNGMSSSLSWNSFSNFCHGKNKISETLSDFIHLHCQIDKHDKSYLLMVP